MWIRSQEGNCLIEVKFIGVTGLNVYGKYEGMQREVILGEYESNLEAMFVLDNIHHHMNEYQYELITGQTPISKIFVMPTRGTVNV